MSEDWRDQLAGARMQVDQQFQSRLEQSEFTNQEWGLIMTAVEFDIEHPGDPDRAEMVADTSQLDQIFPELDRLKEQMGGPMGGGADSGSSGGVLGAFKDLLGGVSGGGSGGTDRERMDAAMDMAEEYATDLQAYLEKRGRWEEIRQAAEGEQSLRD
ncbi:MAG: hypothetical protein BRD23_06385 [Halobacteriales archaeon SW_9_67_25]|jgi:hypothetical protein|nr:MAG: hypothetical protein BRD23_06385 [Halobacteriales archaeon SW_9_67_25]